jgi:hypothetical protein
MTTYPPSCDHLSNALFIAYVSFKCYPEERIMDALRSFVRRNSFVIFVLLAYLLSWWPALTPSGGLLPHGPMLAALIVVAMGEGKAGLKAWWSRIVHFGTSWRWYAVAVAIPAALALTAAGLNILLGAQAPQPIDWSIPLKVLPVALLLSGMWEEPGWTAYALPRLYARFGASPSGTLVAILITGVIRAGWHLPLVLRGSIHWSDFLFSLPYQIVLSWLFNSTGESVPVVMLAHLSSNIFGGELVGTWFTGADWAREAWLRGGLWILLALGLLLIIGLRLGRKPAQHGDKPGVGQPVVA